MKRAISYGEGTMLLPRMPHYTSDMVKLQSAVYDSRTGKPPYPSATTASVSPISPITQPVPQPAIESYHQFNSSSFSNLVPINPDIKPLILIPPFNTQYYSPLQTMQIITNNADNVLRLIVDLPKNKSGHHPIRFTTTNLMITLIIKRGFVPIKSSKLFQLLSHYKTTGTVLDELWTDVKSTGRTPSLRESTVNQLIKQYNSETDGGAAKSKTTLAESDMNIQFRVSNKTESRLAAEFSTRSTISFLVAVLSCRFIRATPSKGHKKTVLELRQYPVYNIVEKVNNKVLGILEGDKDILPLLPILDQLSTSTDEITVFMSDKIIHTKDNWYISKRPSDTDQPFLDSSTRDIFTTDLSGDKHHRGVRVTLNNTFTAGGRCATAFACIYGMTNAEMPHDEIVVRKVPGLIAAQDGDTYTQKK